MWALQLLLLSLLAAQCRGNFLRNLFTTRTLYQLTSFKDTRCETNSDSVLTVDGALKLTTAPTASDAVANRICLNHLVPFGHLVRNSQGIRFWYLRVRVTRLIAGQTLSIVTFDQSIPEYALKDDQRFDLHHGSAYPAIFYLRYRSLQLYWKTTPEANKKNSVNITVALYALFNDSLPVEKRKSLCSRFGHVWCPAASVCISSGSCTLQNDCFDRFTDANKCPDTMWLGSSNSSLSGPGTGSASWLSRNLPWLLFFSVPTFLVFALAKICCQKRELDIDDDYVYKLSADREEPPASNQTPYEDEPRIEFRSSSPRRSCLQQPQQQREQQKPQRQQRQKSSNYKLRPPPPPPPSPPPASVSLINNERIEIDDVNAETTASTTGQEERRESPDGAAAAVIDSGNFRERRLQASPSPPPPPPPPRQQEVQKSTLPRQRCAASGKAKAPQPPSHPLTEPHQPQPECGHVSTLSK